MFRIVVLAVLASGCQEDVCGVLTLELGENAAAYPSSADIGCDVPSGGWWDESKNEAAIRITGSDLPDEAHVVAVMSLDMVRPGATLSAPTSIAGEAYTSDGQNYARLTSGTITIVSDLGVDPSGPARVFEVQWDLTWLGIGDYRSQGESRVWFAARGPL